MASDIIEAREHLVEALEADLVGPYAGPDAETEGAAISEEVLPLPPSRWYLTGFLAPMAARVFASRLREQCLSLVSNGLMRAYRPVAR